MKPMTCFLAMAIMLAGASATLRAADAPAKYTHEASEKLYRAGKYEDGEAMDKQAIADIEKTSGPKAWQLAEPLNDLATILMRQARYADAKAAIDRADVLLDRKVPAQALIAGRLGINKGWLYYTMGEADAAAKVFEESLDLVEKNSKGPSIDRAELMNNLGLMLEDQAEKSEDEDIMTRSKTLLLQGWEMRRQLTGDLSPESGESLNNLGMHMLFHAQSPEEDALAVPTLRKSLEVAIKVYGESHPETAVSHATLAIGLLKDGKLDEAEKEVRIAIPMTQKYFGDKHPDLSSELMTLGFLLERQTHFDEAEQKYLTALQIDEQVYGKSHPNLTHALDALKTLYETKGDAAKAQEMQKRIEKIKGKDI